MLMIKKQRALSSTATALQTVAQLCQLSTLGAQMLTGDEGFYLPNGKLVCLWNAKTIETV